MAFNHGEYDPSSAEGQHVLAHELAHVRQQTGGAVSMLPQTGELEIAHRNRFHTIHQILSWTTILSIRTDQS
ncbi:DUF4157 domain-containing protein [Halogeometricum borinquense]|uniref:DUF4157 domain-containing protein n=1 Tax=Halogeometricum borinquense TaxID=60847 RepID=A0A482T1B2_9EURY|nr:DUF4157 domain-containing protein [Halogeometricum borinquense]